MGAGGTGIAAKTGRNRTITQRQFGRDALYSSDAQQRTRWTSSDSISCRGCPLQPTQKAEFLLWSVFSKIFSQRCRVKGQHYTQERESKPWRKGAAPDPRFQGRGGGGGDDGGPQQQIAEPRQWNVSGRAEKEHGEAQVIKAPSQVLSF